MSKPRCPDCHHAWEFHRGPCQVDDCPCDGLAALAAVSGIETLLHVGDDGWKPVTMIWSLPRAARFSRALRGRLGEDAHDESWRFLLRQLERARTGYIEEGAWREIDAPPPL